MNNALYHPLAPAVAVVPTGSGVLDKHRVGAPPPQLTQLPARPPAVTQALGGGFMPRDLPKGAPRVVPGPGTAQMAAAQTVQGSQPVDLAGLAGAAGGAPARGHHHGGIPGYRVPGM